MSVVWIIVSVILFIIVIALLYRLSKAGREFKQWKEGEKERQKQAILQSRAVLGGKFTEQMAPYLPEFKYDPTEARFIGTPIDLVVFRGHATGETTEIVFIEVKSGRSDRLPPKERRIKELVEAGMVRWELIHRPPKEEEVAAEE